MAIRVGINGFGRIGRNFFRAQLEREGGHRDRRGERPRRRRRRWRTCSSTTRTSGRSTGDVELGDGVIRAGGEEIKLLSERDPGAIPWGDLGVDVVLESTGFFTKRDGAQKHLDAGAKKVVISAPATDPDITIVLGVNDDAYDKDAHHIVSNASCTTNCVAPMAKVLHDAFTIEQGFMTTIHAYTNDQQHPRPAARGPAPRPCGRDQPDPDLDRRRPGDRARAARAARGRSTACRCARPVPTGSVTDLVVTRRPRDDRGRGERGVPRRPPRGPARRATCSTPRTRSSRPTSSDSPYSCIFDSELTMANGTHGQGLRLVRQRVGLLVPARRPDGQAALMRFSQARLLVDDFADGVPLLPGHARAVERASATSRAATRRSTRAPAAVAIFERSGQGEVVELRPPGDSTLLVLEVDDVDADDRAAWTSTSCASLSTSPSGAGASRTCATLPET